MRRVIRANGSQPSAKRGVSYLELANPFIREIYAIMTISAVGRLQVVGEAVTDADAAFLSMLGYTRAEFEDGEMRWRGITPPQWHHPDVSAPASPGAASVFALPYETKLIRKDGAPIPVLLCRASRPDLGADAWTGYAVDLTGGGAFVHETPDVQFDSGFLEPADFHTRLIAELVRERTERFALFDSTPSLMWSVDRDLRLVIGNETFHSRVTLLYGRRLQRGEHVLSDLTPPDVRSSWEAWYDRVLLGEQFVTQSSDDLDGTTMFWSHAFAPIRDGAGLIVGASVVGQDVSDRVQTEQRLTRSERDVRQAQRMARLGSWDWDMQTDAVTMSPVLRELLALPAEGPSPPFEEHVRFYTPESWQRLCHAVCATITHGVPYTVDLELTSKVTARWIVAHGEPVHDDVGAIVGLQGTAFDVTERRLAEQEKRRLERLLIQSQKMDAVGQLAGGIAHDFNNLLTALKLQVSSMHDEPALTNTVTAGLHDIETEIDRAATLTRQLLMFSRRQAMDLRPIELNHVVAGFLRMLGRLIGESVTLRFEEAKESMPLLGDAGMLEQVVMNLVVNARDAMPRGGSITVRTRRVTVTEKEAANSRPEARPGQFIELEVTDTGMGIPAEHAHRVFEPFFTTKEAGRGTGLGLATAYGIVAQHGGWIDFTSDVGIGTSLRVHLPYAKHDALLATAEAPRPLENAHGAAVAHVLLVEDEPALRKLLASTLHRAGFTVETAADGTQALQLWETNPARFDVVVSDMVLPGGISGFELLQRCADTNAVVRRLLMSGYSADIVDRTLTGSASVRMLGKPFSGVEFVRTIRELLETR